MKGYLYLLIIVSLIILSSCGESTISTEPAINSPSSLIAVLLSGSAIQLNWQDNSSDEDGFIIERKIEDEEYIDYAVTTPDITILIDSLLSPNTQYTYRAASFKGEDRSDWCYSNPVLTPVDVNAPSNLLIEFLASDRIDLSWTDNTETETGFLLQRKTGDNQFLDLALLEVNIETYSDTDVETLTQYTYRISAQYDDGQSDWSNQVSTIAPPDLEGLEFGTEESLEIMTWNIENFPKNDLITVAYAAEIVQSLDVDIVALQEIESSSYFDRLLEYLPEWEGYKANSASYDIDLAYLYKSEVVQVDNIYEIYQSDWYAFPRSPLVLEFNSFGEELILINNHLKAGGDSDDEDRREEASEKLEEYIESNFINENVILVGDLNDQIEESEEDNVFWNFISQPELYLFTDMAIAEGSSYNWSYPSWPSHLDHILISDELFDEFEAASSQISTIKVDEYLLNGWNEYDGNVSDHRPVALKIILTN